MKNLIIASLLVLVGMLSVGLVTARHHAGDEYWRGWHQGKLDQFDADNHYIVDGENRN